MLQIVRIEEAERRYRRCGQTPHWKLALAALKLLAYGYRLPAGCYRPCRDSPTLQHAVEHRLKQPANATRYAIGDGGEKRRDWHRWWASCILRSLGGQAMEIVYDAKLTCVATGWRSAYLTSHDVAGPLH